MGVASRFTSDTSRSQSALVLFPGALGDLICFLPSLAALLRRHAAGGVTLVAKPEWLPLLRLPADSMISIDRAEIADLFANAAPIRPTTRALLGGRSRSYSWTGAGDPAFAERLAAISGGHAGVYPFRGMRPAEHAVDYYARCAAVDPAPFASLLRTDDAWFDELARQLDLAGCPLFVVHAGSGSPAKNWTGFAELAECWKQRAGKQARVILLSGPAESPAASFELVPQTVPLRDLALPQVAALLQHCDLYAGNDSGISHLAGAVGARGVVVFGSSDPSVWRPRSARLTVVHEPTECSRCGPGLLCTHRVTVRRAAKPLGI
jgi:ADP-heptose:LPS heptosyltransferase